MIRILVTTADLPDADSVSRPSLYGAMAQTVLLLEREVKLRTPIGASAAARGSIAGEVRGALAGRGQIVGVVGSPLSYIPVIERGRRPGKMPPPDALELWVRRKLKVQNVEEAKGIAFAISRKIAARGTEGAFMFERALEENQGAIRQIFERAGLGITIRIQRDLPEAR